MEYGVDESKLKPFEKLLQNLEGKLMEGQIFRVRVKVLVCGKGGVKVLILGGKGVVKVVFLKGGSSSRLGGKGRVKVLILG